MRLVTCDDKGCTLETSRQIQKGGESVNIKIMSGAGNSGLGAEAPSYLIPISKTGIKVNETVKKRKSRSVSSGRKKQSGAGARPRSKTPVKKKTIKKPAKSPSRTRTKPKVKQAGSTTKRRCVK